VGHNVQSQAGVSLSDVYDVRGGQAPIERLITAEVPAVHEMAATIQSERFSQFIRRDSFAIAQSSNFGLLITGLPAGVSRVLGINVFTDDATRLSHVTSSIQDTGGGATARGMPFWQWDQTNSQTARFLDEGANVNATVLVPTTALQYFPSLITGPDQPQSVPDIALRGATNAFGAGTVTVTFTVLIAFAAVGGISSRGLPIPSW